MNQVLHLCVDVVLQNTHSHSLSLTCTHRASPFKNRFVSFYQYLPQWIPKILYILGTSHIGIKHTYLEQNFKQVAKF